MNRRTVKLPSVLNYQNFNDKCSVFSFDHDAYEEVLFDFTECTRISPTGVVFLSMLRDELCSKGIRTYFRKPTTGVYTFLSSIGLFKNEDDCESMYHESMHKLERCENIHECSDSHRRIRDMFVSRTELSKDTYAAIDYMINEIWDNAGVHGYMCYENPNYPKPIYMSAFTYRDMIEIVIGDRGQGIYNSLYMNNDKVKDLSVQEVLLQALEDEVSGHPQGSPGFGLYCTSEFISKGGGFLHIWSSENYITVSKTKKIEKSYMDIGTIVTIIVNKKSLLPFEDVLNQKSKGVTRDTNEYIEDFIDSLIQ